MHAGLEQWPLGLFEDLKEGFQRDDKGNKPGERARSSVE